MSVICKYVIDTNTLLSAVISPDGNSISAKEYQKALEKGVILASDETFAELVDVIFRKRFDRYISDETRFSFLSSFRKAAIWVEITEAVSDCRDSKDNKFLSLAIQGKATFIISGDEDLLVLNPYHEIPILNSRQYLELE